MSSIISEKLKKRHISGNLRSLKVVENLIDFASNDYLGIAKSKVIAHLIIEEWQKNAFIGSTGSRLLTGNSQYAEKLEVHIASFHGFDTALLFNCGYMANIGLISTVASYDDTILFDTHIHPSTKDGITLAKAKAFPFRHNDLDSLENRLKNIQQKGNRFILIESIYSTDGSTAPLKDIYQIAEKYDAKLIVDEAHALGIFGNSGQGLVQESNLQGKIFAQICTFGKALGCFGAVVLGSSFLKKILLNFSKPTIYTTAPPFYALAAIKCCYQILPTLTHERSHLKKLISICQKHNLNASTTQIQPIYIQGNKACKDFSCQLHHAGFDIRPFLSPTVQKGHECLRLCLHAFNTENELLTLIGHIRR